MIDTEDEDEIKAAPETVYENKLQVWLTVLVMVGSSCVGVTILMVLLWFLFKKVIPPGWF